MTIPLGPLSTALAPGEGPNDPYTGVPILVRPSERAVSRTRWLFMSASIIYDGFMTTHVRSTESELVP